MQRRSLFGFILLILVAVTPGHADPPGLSYIFPAGGQRGTTVNVRVGGFYLYDGAALEVLGTGVTMPAEIRRTDRLWFEGPLIRQPASQQKEDYPQDYLGVMQLAPDAAAGLRLLRTWNAQGPASPLRFIVGELPEVIEQELDGAPIPQKVTLPVTINGRIFPREDVDVWEITADAGKPITCAVDAELIGSGLEARLEVRDSAGQIVAESNGGLRRDPLLRFTPSVSGIYRVHLCDARFSGGQNFVYRLTVTAGVWIDRIYPVGGRRGESLRFEAVGQGIPADGVTLTMPDVAPTVLSQSFVVGGQTTNGVLLDIDELPETFEAAADPSPTLPVPAVANGRIESPGDVDVWPFSASKGTPLRLEIRAARLNSPLDAVLVIKDAAGKEIARAEDLPSGSPDCELDFNPPADGVYSAEISERFASRGGPAFAYRLRITQPQADFQLSVAADAFAVNVGGELKLPVSILRTGEMKTPVIVRAEGLPSGVSAAEVTVASNQNKAELVLKVGADVPVQAVRFTVVGKGDLQDGPVDRVAKILSPQAPPTFGTPGPDHLLLVTTLPVPFKFKGKFELRYTARGGSLRKTFQLERNGYEGPLEARLADKQGRHLQGVTGPVVMIPAGAEEFDYTVSLPPWMELGRTSRANLMLTGDIKDAAGKTHKVCFVTNEQNEQLIALVSPGPLSLALDRAVVAVEADREMVIPVRILRRPGLDSACRIEVVVPSGMNDVSADSLTTPPLAAQCEVRLRFGKSPGPFIQPLTIRATAERDGEPVVAETSLELIAKPR